ncbi:hypothetical protein IGV50_004405 [Salmonella enterica subsp. enterica serovar Newport]|nr:hypothetical protein [Salmonella enterica subsp. enterica serovar Newport]
MLKAELQAEVTRLTEIIMNTARHFDHLTDEQKSEIHNIFDELYNPTKPATIFGVLGEAAAYILRGKL